MFFIGIDHTRIQMFNKVEISYGLYANYEIKYQLNICNKELSLLFKLTESS